MRTAGCADGSWTLLVQNYPSPSPNGVGSSSGKFGFGRQSTSGCGLRRGRRFRGRRCLHPQPVRSAYASAAV